MYQVKGVIKNGPNANSTHCTVYALAPSMNGYNSTGI